ncbi:MAG: M48 family metallopeptidase [Candidatus Gracilibacteria bacterium]
MALAYTQISKNKWESGGILLLFMVFVMAVGFLLAEVQSPGGGMIGLIIAAAISFIWTLVAYFTGDKIALAANGAKPIQKQDNPMVYNLVENLCISAGLPVPKIYLIQSEAMNAFATGRKPETASIAITTGLLSRLEKKEVEGVVAHELSHIGNYDIRLMTLVAALAGVIMILTDIFWHWSFHSRGGGGRKSGQLQLIMMVVGLVLIIFAPLISMLMQLAISRKREFLADASGALLTRYPEGLASALEKISQDSTPLPTASHGTAHLYISSPFKKKTWSNLFSTHPPIEARVKALREMNL